MYYSIHDQNKELAMNMIAFLPLLCCEPKRARSDGWFHRFHGYVIVAVLQNVSPALSPAIDRPAAVRRCLEDSGNKGWFGKPRADAKTERAGSSCLFPVRACR
jgi:hypothetical protein